MSGHAPHRGSGGQRPPGILDYAVNRRSSGTIGDALTLEYSPDAEGASIARAGPPKGCDRSHFQFFDSTTARETVHLKLLLPRAIAHQHKNKHTNKKLTASEKEGRRRASSNDSMRPRQVLANAGAISAGLHVNPRLQKQALEMKRQWLLRKRLLIKLPTVFKGGHYWIFRLFPNLKTVTLRCDRKM